MEVHEEMKPEEAGAEAAFVLMLRQLYTLAAKAHDVGAPGLVAWRGDILRELRKHLPATGDGENKALESAQLVVNGVFHTITDPPRT